VWALGILLYTIMYKENPFYNIGESDRTSIVSNHNSQPRTDEILDHPLRIPYNPFSDDCLDLVQRMLDRDVECRIDIEGVVAHPWLQASS
jgi:protein-serine/threonine kinase